jgi:hypothetical protein
VVSIRWEINIMVGHLLLSYCQTCLQMESKMSSTRVESSNRGGHSGRAAEMGQYL